MPLRSPIEFGAVGQYSVRGDTEVAKSSRAVRDAIKRGDVALFDRVAVYVRDHADTLPLRPLFGADVMLVPAPASAPQREQALWVPQLICGALVRAGLAAHSQRWLRRKYAVKKSAFAAPGERPDAQVHYASIEATASLDTPTRIVVVDDIVTRGCTLLAAASLLADAYPARDRQSVCNPEGCQRR